MERHPLALEGYAARRPEFRTVVSPFDREPLFEVEHAAEDALDHALETARRVQDTLWRETPAWQRAAWLDAAADRVRADGEALARLIAAEGGKPLKDARVEASRAAVTLEECARAALRLEGHAVGMERAPGTENRLAFTLREPIGVVLAISAFNHPLNLCCHQAGAALAAGNTCILKPASSTPRSAIRLGAILRECGLPEGVLQIVPTPGRRAAHLVASPAVDFITFIGSAEVGWAIRRQAADGTRLAAEHGGNAASIVLADADLDHAVPLIVRGAFYHAGQVCVSTQRLYVEHTIEPELTARLVAAAAALRCGDPRDAATDVGPLIEPAEVRRVHAWVDEARAAGAEVLAGGAPLSETVYGTTVLRGAPEEAKVIAEEVFGPVVTVQPVASLAEAIAKVNRSTNPFQSSIFTRDVDRAFQAAREVASSAFLINDFTAFRVDWMPFGGRKHAGLGLGGVDHGVLDMTEEKLIVINAR
ncbi:MAG: aldehyde dehydrogenase family protein [Planctomycetes bacterium]|nr:aldehyde dehydrogenase family protein [Planctomycetota bacterium]